jgi:hypothetical protein
VASGSAVNPSLSGWTCPAGLDGSLDAGVAYRLVIGGVGLTTYSIEKGSAYGFEASTYFRDGSVDGDSRADLQFYFR